MIEKPTAAAAVRCQAVGLRWTSSRAAVLAALQRAKRPLSAYELCARLNEGSRRWQPPSVYRALEALQQAGLVIWLASQQKYLVCRHPQCQAEHHISLICQQCGEVSDLHEPHWLARLQEKINPTVFRIQRPMVELYGLGLPMMPSHNS